MGKKGIIRQTPSEMNAAVPNWKITLEINSLIASNEGCARVLLRYYCLRGDLESMKKQYDIS